MRYTSDSETSTPLPDPGKPGETADRNTQTQVSRFCCARYTPGFDGPMGRYVYDLTDDEEVENA